MKPIFSSRIGVNRVVYVVNASQLFMDCANCEAPLPLYLIYLENTDEAPN